jgi:hypothetical protein
MADFCKIHSTKMIKFMLRSVAARVTSEPVPSIHIANLSP